MLSVTHRSWRFLLALLMLVGVYSAASAEGTVTDVKVVGGSNTVRIEVSASGPVQHRAKALTQPQHQIIVDVFPAKLGKGVGGEMPINKGLVSNATVKQLTDNTVRVTINTISLPDYKVVTATGSKGLTLSVSTVTMAEGKATTAPAEPVQAAEPVPAKQQPVAQKVSVKPVRVAQAPVAPAAPRMQALTGSGQATSALRRRPAPRRVAPKQKLVTLDFVNADLVYVIKVLAKEMNRNVYIGPGVEGSVTVTLKSVPVDGALALVLKMQENDIAYKMVGYNTLIVAAPEKVNQIEDDILGKTMGPRVPRANAVRQEILLEKAPAAKVISFLQSQYKNVEFIPHPTMNGFYVVGSRADVLQIKGDVPNLDKVPDVPPPPQREFVQVKYGDLNEVKSLLATLVPDVQMNVDTRQSMLILEGAPGAIEQAKELLDQIDKPLEQVVIECKVVDLTEAGRKNLGVLWGSQNGAAGATNITFEEAYRGTLGIPLAQVGQPNAQVQQFGPFEMLGNFNQGIGAFQGFQTLAGARAFPLGIGTFARSGLALSANLNFLVSQNEAKVLASPRVAAQSGTEAQIHIGDKFPIVYFDPRAGQFQVNYVDIGIKLDVTAQVKTDGYVVCKILPEVSTLVELVNNQYPRTAVRKVTTDARIKDGETLVLGGLIREEDIQAVQKVPLLGDLPILGSLFRNTSVTKTRNEVVIMLTPQIMK